MWVWRDKTIKLFLIEAKRKQLKLLMKLRVAFVRYTHVFIFGFLDFYLFHSVVAAAAAVAIMHVGISVFWIKTSEWTHTHIKKQKKKPQKTYSFNEINIFIFSFIRSYFVVVTTTSMCILVTIFFVYFVVCLISFVLHFDSQFKSGRLNVCAS